MHTESGINPCDQDSQRARDTVEYVDDSKRELRGKERRSGSFRKGRAAEEIKRIVERDGEAERWGVGRRGVATVGRSGGEGNEIKARTDERRPMARISPTTGSAQHPMIRRRLGVGGSAHVRPRWTD